MRVRPATPEDLPGVVALMRELAAFERMAGPDDEAARRLAEDPFARRRIDVLVGEAEGETVAYAVLLETYSTFAARPVLYLEDLYVTPAARRSGVATAMMRAVAQEALRRGCARVAWIVLDWNEPARRFYAALGAKETTWVTCQLEGEALARVAEKGQEGRPARRPPGEGTAGVGG